MTNLNIMIDNGKYSIDGYDWFDSLEALQTEIEWQTKWIDGKARKDENGEWVEVENLDTTTEEEPDNDPEFGSCEIFRVYVSGCNWNSHEEWVRYNNLPEIEKAEEDHIYPCYRVSVNEENITLWPVWGGTQVFPRVHHSIAINDRGIALKGPDFKPFTAIAE